MTICVAFAGQIAVSVPGGGGSLSELQPLTRLTRLTSAGTARQRAPPAIRRKRRCCMPSE